MKLRLKIDPHAFSDRDSALRAFRTPLKEAIGQTETNLRNPVQLVYILSELAKNTIDHSSGIGILDIELPTDTTPLSATYLDTGEPFDFEYLSAPGLSSKKGNGQNQGLGRGHPRGCRRCRACIIDKPYCRRHRVPVCEPAHDTQG